LNLFINKTLKLKKTFLLPIQTLSFILKSHIFTACNYLILKAPINLILPFSLTLNKHSFLLTLLNTHLKVLLQDFKSDKLNVHLNYSSIHLISNAMKSAPLSRIPLILKHLFVFLVLKNVLLAAHHLISVLINHKFKGLWSLFSLRISYLLNKIFYK
jgi:hypothetical protein